MTFFSFDGESPAAVSVLTTDTKYVAMIRTKEVRATPLILHVYRSRSRIVS